MRFQKGNKASRGGTKGNKGGRPSKDETEFREAVRVVVEREINRVAQKLAKRYVDRAMQSDRVLMHLIDKLVPAARQDFDMNVHGSVTIITNVNPDADR